MSECPYYKNYCRFQPEYSEYCQSKDYYDCPEYRHKIFKQYYCTKCDTFHSQGRLYIEHKGYRRKWARKRNE